MLRPDLNHDEAGDVVWTYIDAGLYHRLVVEREWTPAAFQEWFTETLCQYLMGFRS
jgi:hypothetical protein